MTSLPGPKQEDRGHLIYLNLPHILFVDHHFLFFNPVRGTENRSRYDKQVFALLFTQPNHQSQPSLVCHGRIFAEQILTTPVLSCPTLKRSPNQIITILHKRWRSKAFRRRTRPARQFHVPQPCNETECTVLQHTRPARFIQKSGRCHQWFSAAYATRPWYIRWSSLPFSCYQRSSLHSRGF